MSPFTKKMLIVVSALPIFTSGLYVGISLAAIFKPSIIETKSMDELSGSDGLLIVLLFFSFLLWLLSILITLIAAIEYRKAISEKKLLLLPFIPVGLFVLSALIQELLVN